MGDRTSYQLTVKGVSAADLPFLAGLAEQVEFSDVTDTLEAGQWFASVDEHSCGDADELAIAVITAMKDAGKPFAFRLNEAPKYEWPGYTALYIPALEGEYTYFGAHSDDDGLQVGVGRLDDLVEQSAGNFDVLVALLHAETGRDHRLAWDAA
ncbi:hypothetical protein [Tessaracoccus sp.]